MHPGTLRIADYTYILPDDRIAHHPLPERDASRLLIYKDGAISEDIYRHLPAHIAPGTLLVFNHTRVVHARLQFRKPTGGAIEVFCLSPGAQYPDVATAMGQRGNVLWECLVGGASKWKPGMLLHITHNQPGFTLTARMEGATTGAYLLRLDWDDATLTFADVLHHIGKVPLPPYLNREAAPSDETRYQTVFAKHDGSVAAPTAGLHFTEGILQELQHNGCSLAAVTLHVGAGTFRPVKSNTMLEHDMHAEWIDVTHETITQLIQQGNDKIVAVGTTALRTLESLYWIGYLLANTLPVDWQGIAVTQWLPYEASAPACTTQEALEAIARELAAKGTTRITTRTQILIAPGYKFHMVQGLITNFHQPQSTLLLLVAALIGDDWKKVYNYALQHQFRFLSYGDGSLLWRRDQ